MRPILSAISVVNRLRKRHISLPTPPIQQAQNLSIDSRIRIPQKDPDTTHMA